MIGNHLDLATETNSSVQNFGVSKCGIKRGAKILFHKNILINVNERTD